MFHLFGENLGREGENLLVTGEQYVHMVNVLRMKKADTVEVSLPGEGTRTCVIEDIREDAVVLAPGKENASERELPVRVVLYQGIPKADKLEFIIQKAVELGVSAVVPVAMKRSIAKVEPARAGKKRERWQKIAEAAAMQSRRDFIPEVREPLSFAEALREAAKADHLLIPYELEDGQASTYKAVSSIRPGETVAFFIGPEGGIEEAEVRAVEEAGGRAISLGRRILRTETAGLCFLSWLVWQLEFAQGEEKQETI